MAESTPWPNPESNPDDVFGWPLMPNAYLPPRRPEELTPEEAVLASSFIIGISPKDKHLYVQTKIPIESSAYDDSVLTDEPVGLMRVVDIMSSDFRSYYVADIRLMRPGDIMYDRSIDRKLSGDQEAEVPQADVGHVRVAAVVYEADNGEIAVDGIEWLKPYGIQLAQEVDRMTHAGAYSKDEDDEAGQEGPTLIRPAGEPDDSPTEGLDPEQPAA